MKLDKVNISEVMKERVEKIREILISIFPENKETIKVIAVPDLIENFRSVCRKYLNIPDSDKVSISTLIVWAEIRLNPLNLSNRVNRGTNAIRVNVNDDDGNEHNEEIELDFLTNMDGNRFAAKTFTSAIRAQARGIIATMGHSQGYISTHDYDRDRHAEISAFDLRMLADYFQIPFLAFSVGEPKHWVLALEMPKYNHELGYWSVKVYNSFDAEPQVISLNKGAWSELFYEQYSKNRIKLKRSDDELQNEETKIMMRGTCISKELMKQIKEGKVTYDYNIPSGDPSSIRSAKDVNTQDVNNVWDCGFLDLYAALLRASYLDNPGFEKFKKNGLRNVLRLTGVSFLTADV